MNMNKSLTLMMSGLATLAMPFRVLAIALVCLVAIGDARAQAAAAAVALPAPPAATVQALLQRHFSEDMGFTPASVARKAQWLTPALQQRLAAGFAKPVPDDEVPDIDGDPFTNSQDSPRGFHVERARVQADHADVPVRFSGNGSRQRVHFLLRLAQGAWRIDDMAYEDGSTLRGLLP